MASSKFFPIIVLTYLLSIYTPGSSFEDHGISLQIAPSPPTLAKAEKVNLSLYYETLCPYCAKFIVNGLTKVFNREFFNIVNLRLVPYGNAHIQQPGDTVVCQHGPDECYLNSIEACAINSWPDVGQHYKFIYCVEKKFNQTSGGMQSKEDAWKSCCKQLGLNSKTVQDCYDSKLEKKLILKYANETDHLVPPHEYVPWVVVNKQPLLTEYQNFVHYVCVAYKGSPKPKICSSLPPKINSAGNADSNRLGCYKDEEQRK